MKGQVPTMDEILTAVRSENLADRFAAALAEIVPEEQQRAAEQAVDFDEFDEMDGPAMVVALTRASVEQAWVALERARAQ